MNAPIHASHSACPDVVRAPGRGRAITLRRQLDRITIAWLFGSAWLWTISGAAMTQFSRALGMPDYGFGILAALPFIGTLVQVPASYWQERFGHRKALFLLAGTAGRLLWTVAALIPWFMPGAEQWWWQTMILALLVSWAAAQAATPAWMNWMSDIIPRKVRGRYFAVRNLLGQPVGLVVTVAIGYALDMAEVVQTDRPDLMLKVTSAIIAVAGLVGAMDILCFRKVEDPAPPPRRGDVNLLSLLWLPLRDESFRRYITFNFVFMLGVGFIGQYVWLYLFDVVGWSNWRANLLLIGVPLLLRMFSYPLWGRMIDRLGKKPVLLITGFVTIWGAFGWLLITPDHFWVGYTMIAVTALVWPGMEIANFNFTLDLAGSRQSGKRTPTQDKQAAGTAFVAINSIAIAVGGVLSGLLGAVIAKGFHDWTGPTLPLIDMALTYHGLLFMLSTLLRAASLLWALGLDEPRATGTRDAIRYMTDSFYSNVRQAVFMPARIVSRALRASYRIGG